MNSEIRTLTVQANINSSMDNVWNCWTAPEHIIHWNFASDDWHTPRAENDIRPGGKFKWHMAAKDGSVGFDFEGVYSVAKKHELIEYAMADGRKVSISFVQQGDQVVVTEKFDAENENPLELQLQGWQAILNNFKKYTESIL